MDNNQHLEALNELIEHFKENIKQYKSNSYDEANTRVDFIDKFFVLLGWDVRNTAKYSEQYREVVREDKVVIAGKPKAPDYSFRIGGQRKFFVEAKKPSVDIQHDIGAAFQVRRYAYSAKLKLSILTDFEEFAVYDTRIKPNKNDKASTARIFYCTYDEYPKHLDYLINTFSPEAIRKGSFDRYVDDNKKKKGTSEVDREFLKMIEGWRNTLAKNIALRNISLTIYDLNYAVQKIIDRLIFLRFAEDRHIDDYGGLMLASADKDGYSKLDGIFKKADEKYNSGLFRQEAWLSSLDIDGKILFGITQSLYYPECPYEFSVLPIEILGNIYEQFLGKTIRLTSSHQAKVEEKPEVRKAGGVYYTPQYIVDYIVANTVGVKIANKKPAEIAKVSILDPACGSGSFLVRVYIFLLDYHLTYYTADKNIKSALKKGIIYQPDSTTYRLSVEEKQSILLNNIYGVDIDNQAVEVTKLSLLLKLMEDETAQSAEDLFKYHQLKLLPDLSNNIKCGNSLIGSDFYTNKEMSLFGDDEIRKVNAFDWAKEFSGVMGEGISKFNHITFETKYSRRRGRVHTLKGVVQGENAGTRNRTLQGAEYTPVLLNDKERIEVAKCIVKKANENHFKILACAILPDHVHLIIADMGEDVEKIVNLIKGYSAHHINHTLKGAVQGGGRQLHLWAKRYNNAYLDSEKHLYNAIEYVNSNYLKHEETWGKLDTTEVDSILQKVIYDTSNGIKWKDFECQNGFDVVVGNPPYIRQENIMDYKEPLRLAGYVVYTGTSDIYTYFYEKAYNLLADGGVVSFITSNKWMRANYGKKLREFFKSRTVIKNIIDFGGYQVFSGATVDTNILVAEKSQNNNNYEIPFVSIGNDFEGENLSEYVESRTQTIDENDLTVDSFTLMSKAEVRIKRRIEKVGTPLKDWDIVINRGITTGFNEAFIIDGATKDKLIAEDPKSAEIIKPILRGRDIKSYAYKFADKWLLFIPWHFPLHKDPTISGASRKAESEFKKQYSAIYNHLLQYKSKLSNRNKAETGIRYEWYALQRCAATYYEEFKKEKIIWPVIASANHLFTYDNKGIYHNDKVFMLVGNSNKYIIGILNSSLLFWHLKKICSPLGNVGFELRKIYIETIPIPKPNNKQHDRMVSLVTQMLTAQADLQTATSDSTTTPSSVRFKQQRVDILDKQIDGLVYELYGLTDEEIGIVDPP